MNFLPAERLRERIQLNNELLKKKTTKHAKILKDQNEIFVSLCSELDDLKEQFEIFKMNTLSHIEKSDYFLNNNEIITKPFEIYSIKK